MEHSEYKRSCVFCNHNSRDCGGGSGGYSCHFICMCCEHSKPCGECKRGPSKDLKISYDHGQCEKTCDHALLLCKNCRRKFHSCEYCSTNEWDVDHSIGGNSCIHKDLLLCEKCHYVIMDVIHDFPTVIKALHTDRKGIVKSCKTK